MGSGGDAALVTRTTRRGRVADVALRGELDLSTAPTLRGCLAGLLQEEPPPEKVVLDLSELSFVDASGISALLSAQQALRSRGGSVVLRSPSRLVRRVVKVLDLEQALPVER